MSAGLRLNVSRAVAGRKDQTFLSRLHLLKVVKNEKNELFFPNAKSVAKQLNPLFCVARDRILKKSPKVNFAEKLNKTVTDYIHQVIYDEGQFPTSRVSADILKTLLSDCYGEGFEHVANTIIPSDSYIPGALAKAFTMSLAGMAPEGDNKYIDTPVYHGAAELIVFQRGLPYTIAPVKGGTTIDRPINGVEYTLGQLANLDTIDISYGVDVRGDNVTQDSINASSRSINELPEDRLIEKLVLKVIVVLNALQLKRELDIAHEHVKDDIVGFGLQLLKQYSFLAGIDRDLCNLMISIADNKEASFNDVSRYWSEIRSGSRDLDTIGMVAKFTNGALKICQGEDVKLTIRPTRIV
ncbi:nonstructural protein sigma NS [Baboon orthoreovirus]|uniref:Nonstructural protein sigma NS n=1 Tax=Baboon orthoreovirus TaxID=75888 RepID=O72469_9REOV|nr:nonstructural protein sigma NS [Baboon orthoreovirus]AAC18132.1 nonstructural protein sigma NS [Baboon orthoreovirus]